MRVLVLVFCLLPLAVKAGDQEQLVRMLSTAAIAHSNDYIVARDAVVALGTNALPALADVGSDAQLSWAERLAARIAYERIVRQSEIQALRSRDWRTVPGYDRTWERNIIGPSGHMTPLVKEEFGKLGLWYYDIEVIWKETQELCEGRDHRMKGYWPRWCQVAVTGQPEEAYLFLAMEDRLRKDPAMQSPDAVVLYNTLCNHKVADAVPVLVERYDAFCGREVYGGEAYPGSRAVTLQGMFEPILEFADSRHADLMDQFIASHPALEPLKGRVDEIRARPAQTPKPEPPFRLGTNLVVLVSRPADTVVPIPVPPPAATSVPPAAVQSNKPPPLAKPIVPNPATPHSDRNPTVYVIGIILVAFIAGWAILRSRR